ncbi:MAG: TetR family transcriptional regulator [Pseudomonadota bacterium]|nr:TetR family transcriptional regulator [Pseudomonadota bacterium]
MSHSAEKPEGLRERKRRQTRQRLAETGLRLFLEQGYEQTTLDAIAEAAGVSRRTVFHYFEQKEDILLAWRSGLGEAIRAAILRERPDRPPLDIVLAALLQLAAQYQAEDHIRIERLLASSERLGASKLAKYAQQEQAVYEALAALWPAPERRERLRLVAMIAVGALRVAFERWAERGGADPLTAHLRRAFAEVKAAIETGG